MYSLATQFGACSVRVLTGFNHTSPSEVPYQFGVLLACILAEKSIAGGWQGGGCELLLGVECDSMNPNQKPGHRYSKHTGHVFQKLVAKLGLGSVTLTPWSSGNTDTGSKMRTIQWDMLPREEIQAKVAEARAAGWPGEWTVVSQGLIATERW